MIAIKDMEMPKCCHWDCPLSNEDGGACMLGAYDTKTDTKVVAWQPLPEPYKESEE